MLQTTGDSVMTFRSFALPDAHLDFI